MTIGPEDRLRLWVREDLLHRLPKPVFVGVSLEEFVYVEFTNNTINKLACHMAGVFVPETTVEINNG